VFERIVGEYTERAKAIGIADFVAMPISGFMGDNITTRSTNMPWYEGPALLSYLETVELDASTNQAAPFRMAVQWVNRPNLDFRGFSGLISSGTVKPGDPVCVLPSGKRSSVSRIVTFDGDLEQAIAGQSVTLTLTDEVDCSRGDVIAAADQPVQSADQFRATIVWMDEADLLPGRPYWLKSGARTVTARVQAPKYQVGAHNLEHLAVKTLGLNAIGVANLTTDRPLPFEPYADNRSLGGFILIDKMTNATVAAGMLDYALRRAVNVHWQATEVDRDHRARAKEQKPAVLWLTGLSGAGKSTIANIVEKKLASMSRHTFLLDGDNVRHGLNKDLGFTDADRVENIRRVGEVAKLMTDAGLIVITALISPFRAEREMVRQMIRAGEFFEVFIDTPLRQAEQRDAKGLYKKARTGQLQHFTGIDSPYERPESPELRIDTTQTTPEQAADAIIALLMR
jgi:bifunctional enzyme CysN/CysC